MIKQKVEKLVLQFPESSSIIQAPAAAQFSGASYGGDIFSYGGEGQSYGGDIFSYGGEGQSYGGDIFSYGGDIFK